MEGRNIRSWIITLVLAAGLVPACQLFGAQYQTQKTGRQSPTSGAQQTPEQKPPGAQQVPPSMRQQPGPGKVRTYYGKVIKAKNGKYALLTNAKTGQGYYLDNQNKAKRYLQKKVDVTARLDAATSTLHVITIKPAA